MKVKNRDEIYKCNICGNVVEVLTAGGGELVCCGKPMELIESKSKDVGVEKHLPVVEKSADGIKVKVGSVAHPMEEEHFIEWIEIIDGDKMIRKYLSPKDKPEAVFCEQSGEILVRAYCNVHGLWEM